MLTIRALFAISRTLALVSLSILVYFERYHRDEVNWWKTRLAPLISFFTQAYVVYLLFKNITFRGGGYVYANWLGPIDGGVVVLGVAAEDPVRRREYQVDDLLLLRDHVGDRRTRHADPGAKVADVGDVQRLAEHFDGAVRRRQERRDHL